MEIIPTVVPAAFAEAEAAAERATLFASSLHLDFSDGVFAPNVTWLPEIGERLSPRGAFSYEAHLMVSVPREVGLRAISAGASRVIGHIEAMGERAGTILADWKAAGAAEVGLAILFDTPLESLDPFIVQCDVVQVMTIRAIGMQGLPFESSAPARVAQLHANHPRLAISVDGGVSESTIESLARAGASRFCAGSAISKAFNPREAYDTLLALAQNAVQ